MELQWYWIVPAERMGAGWFLLLTGNNFTPQKLGSQQDRVGYSLRVVDSSDLSKETSFCFALFFVYGFDTEHNLFYVPLQAKGGFFDVGVGDALFIEVDDVWWWFFFWICFTYHFGFGLELA